MKCFNCESGEFENRLVRAEGEIKGKQYTVETPALVCNACGHIALEGKDAQEFMRRIADAYRLAHQLLTSDQIRSIRGNLSQLRFAQEIGVGSVSVKRWELGLVQNKSNDKLMRDFAKYSKKRYVYEVPVAASALLAAMAAGISASPEEHANGPPALQYAHLSSPPLVGPQ